ncbi:MAG: tRNA (5-methylaminomethyl-2-thiouridine)(34)-methyltransferase MnmD [Bacteroidetes bacterium]|nr:tRNA (5-methylaminomethyl-2-thiouridine)(34)-methyltransferase MnmD [Bacteroidota bacterium]
MMAGSGSPELDFPANDWRAVCTADGSFTLDSASLGEHYHSAFGALTESLHVYMGHGLRSLPQRRIDILEVGLGTGLNALLSWHEAEAGSKEVRYCALEPFPVPESLWTSLDHPGAMGLRELEPGYRRIMSAAPGEPITLSGHYSFQFLPQRVQSLDATESFDLVFHDAFAPGVQPEMWNLDVFRKLFRALRAGGVLVTYCSKGEVRRTMVHAGFRVERLPGPPGKREMLRAVKL